MTFKVVISMYNRPPSDLTLKVIRAAGMDVEYIPARTENEVISAATGAARTRAHKLMDKNP